MKVKKVPIRKCVGCGENKPKRELIRIVKNKDKEIFIDLKGKANGRGVYICNSIDCLQAAIKNKSIERSFEQKIDADLFEELKNTLIEQEDLQ